MQYVLKKPAVSPVNKQNITSVEVRSPVLAGDWRAASRAANGNADERLFHMVCRMTGLDTKEVEQFSMPDFQAIVDMIDFGDNDPKAPSSTSP